MKDLDLSELDLTNIGNWPIAIRAVVITLISVAVLAGGYFLDIKNQQGILERAQNDEIKDKRIFEQKQAKAVNLDAYRQQMKEMEESFGTMLRQLPDKTEVEDLLVDVSQTGLASGIEFQLFKPTKEQFKEFYAELPIRIKMTGTYHQFGSFVSGVAALPRIVTLHNIKISKGKKDALLSMELTAKTYRYLDENEISKQRQKNKKGKKRR